MSNFKPSVTVTTNESLRNYRNDYSSKLRSYEYHEYSTNDELRKNLKRHLNQSIDGTVSVSRSRRGSWGEWFENWELKDGKPFIVKQGWM